MSDRSLATWPSHMQAIFAFIGQLMGKKRLEPDIIASLVEDHSIIAGHLVTISHSSAAERDGKRGLYIVVVKGPRIDGRWGFRSGEIERLSREAAETRYGTLNRRLQSRRT